MNTDKSTPTHTPMPVTEIAFILDRSGSMSSVTESAIAGFNRFLRDQQAADAADAEGIARLTLVLFDDRYEVPVDNIPVSEAVELDTTTYVPRGTTALLDAIGTTIRNVRRRHKALPQAERPEKVIFAIFTDGLENASRRHTWQDIAARIEKRREKDGWEFLFLGANQDAIATAAQMNIRARDAATYHSSAEGTLHAKAAFSRKVSSLRAGSKADASGVREDAAKSLSEILDEEERRDEV